MKFIDIVKGRPNTDGTCKKCGRERKLPRDRSVCYSCLCLAASISRGEIRKPSFPDVNTKIYKEPMQRVEEGFGYYGALTTTNDGKHVQCHLCGYFYRNLGVHVRNNHKMEVRDYRIKYGLRLKESLLAPVEKVKAQERYNLYARKTREEFRAMAALAQATIKEKGIKPGGNMWTAQTRNEKGNCREQTIAKIKACAALNDGYLIITTFLSEYGYGQTSVVNSHFGSWDNAIKEAGVMSWRDRLKTAAGQRRQETLGAIQRFYREEGRTPQSSDFVRVDYLPSYDKVSSQFGTLNAARRAAEVPELLYHRGLGWVEV